ncbi:MBL fold metallo-hydrolase [Thauera propionica]|uniref:MBL fold metallo-hydrolase n=1 Tax=Thauera propionica TaxID=2019431 RepID=A0A235EY34_9RHOO|nr:quinoprotein relay system zinc metallohydrolase 1 [Thauera propionica]OYD53949.1 MBL fold metallo-hydrolase [Thauera propionica]
MKRLGSTARSWRYVLLAFMLAPLLLALALDRAHARDSAAFDYGLVPRQIADGVYVLEGRKEDFSTANGGDIANTGFIVGTAGVIVIDTGSSRRYGEQMRVAIARITPLPVVLTINTHHHPDHFLGNQAFPPDTLAALPATIAGIEAEGGAFNDNLYRLVGDWMRDTEVVVPRRRLAAGRQLVAGRDIELLALGGHTAADLVVIDHVSGTVFAADLVFNGRAPTTPHADIPRWMEAIAQLERLPARRWVPGHGAVHEDTEPLRQTRAYLDWLSRTLQAAAESGLDMAEAMTLPVAAEFRTLALVEHEYRRSVVHLFPAAERAALGSR